MKKTFFITLTLLSIFSYGIAGDMIRTHYSEESYGMMLIFLIPSLLFGLVTGGIALYLKRTKAFELNRFLVGLHYVNLLLLVFGIAALVYVFFE